MWQMTLFVLPSRLGRVSRAPRKRRFLVGMSAATRDITSCYYGFLVHNIRYNDKSIAHNCPSFFPTTFTSSWTRKSGGKIGRSDDGLDADIVATTHLFTMCRLTISCQPYGHQVLHFETVRCIFVVYREHRVKAAFKVINIEWMNGALCLALLYAGEHPELHVAAAANCTQTLQLLLL